MEAGMSPLSRSRGLRVLDRVAAGFLLVLMAVGSLVLWIGVPAGSLYAAAQLTETTAQHFLLALPITLAAMILFGWLLFWINGIYLRVSGVIEASADNEMHDQDSERHPPRGPLELFLVGSLVIALIAFVVWFFGFAERPCSFSACP
jgi:cytochrome b561